MKDAVEKTHLSFFFLFASTRKVGRRNKSQEQACGAPGGRKRRHSSSSHVCAALRCPHLRRTHVVLIHRMRTDSFTLSASLSRSKPSLLSLHLSRQLCLCSHSCSSDSSLLFFHNSYFSYPLPTSFLYGFTFLMKSFLPFSLFVSPEHISYCCTCHPLHSEIFEVFSYRSIAAVSLQDVLPTSHIPLL